MIFLLALLIVHLIRRRRTVILKFSSTRFLKSSAIKASKIRRLKKLLLLLTRLSIVVLLILIFAQPYNPKDPFRIISGSNTAIYCWIDPTISMDYKRKHITLWNEACSMASVLDSILPLTSVFYCYDGRRDDFVDIRRTGLSDRIEEEFTPVRHGTIDIESMTQKFNSFKKTDSRTPFLVLFSDFQEKDKDEFNFFLKKAPVSTPILLVSLADEHAWNYSIYGANISIKESPLLQVNVKAQGRKLSGGEIVVLTESMRAGYETVNIKKNDSSAISITTSNHVKSNGGEVRLMTDDPYPYDNVIYFTGEQSVKKRIIIITEGDESFPIATAFRSLSASRWHTPIVKHPQDISYNDLDSSDIIVLNCITEPTEILSSLCGSKTFSKKIILFTPEMDIGRGNWNSIVFKYLNAVPGLNRIESEKPLFPVLPDTVSSVWRGFPRFTDRNVSFYAYYTIIPGNVLLRLNKGVPLISHLIDSAGCSWIVFASPIGITNANNLCETGFYLPLLDRVIRYANESIKKNAGTWIAGIPKNNPYHGERTSAQIFNSNNKLIALWNRQPQVKFETPGLYKIHPRGERSYMISAISDSSEGYCKYQNPDIQKFSSKNIKFLNRSSFVTFIQNHRTLPCFDLFWLLLAICLILEIVLWDNKKFK